MLVFAIFHSPVVSHFPVNYVSLQAKVIDFCSTAPSPRGLKPLSSQELVAQMDTENTGQIDREELFDALMSPKSPSTDGKFRGKWSYDSYHVKAIGDDDHNIFIYMVYSG